jgi:predicted CXXCH cytochrome family protein
VGEVARPHAALTRDGCTACHDPHGSNNAGLLAASVNALCSGCHEQQKLGDHVSKPAHKIAGGSDPKHRDREFNCISCHDPHGTDNPKLFYFGSTPQGMCVYCHEKRGSTVSRSGP